MNFTTTGEVVLTDFSNENKAYFDTLNKEFKDLIRYCSLHTTRRISKKELFIASIFVATRRMLRYSELTDAFLKAYIVNHKINKAILLQKVNRLIEKVKTDVQELLAERTLAGIRSC